MTTTPLARGGEALPKATDRYTTEQIEEFYSRGYWREITFTGYLDRFAEEAPDRIFVSDGTLELTYAQVRASAYRLALRMREWGIAPGDRVAVQLPNWSEFVPVYAAIARIGAILVPVMPVYREHEVEYGLQHSGAVAVFTAANFRGFDHAGMYLRLQEACPELRRIVVVRGEGADGTTALTDVIGAFDDLSFPDAAALGAPPDVDDPHLIVFTSGTESRAKGCVHTWNTASFIMRETGAVLGLGPEDVGFMPSPVTHTTGLYMGVGAALVVGGGVHLLDKWDPETALERIAKYRCTHTTTAATFLHGVVAAFDPARHDMSSMRVWLSGGAPIPKKLVMDAAAAFPGCEVISLYGRSEGPSTTMCRLGDSIEVVANSDGRAHPGIEVKIVGPDGGEVPRGTEGEIFSRGPGTMLGYWRDPGKTAALIDAEGWCGSGDLGRMDENGYVRVTGRSKDVIVRGGTNISAREIEELLMLHPSVAQAAVVGMSDERLGEKVCAFIVPNGDVASAEQILRFLRDDQHLAVQKLPERMEFIDALPTTASGKVQKFALRQLAADLNQRA